MDVAINMDPAFPSVAPFFSGKCSEVYKARSLKVRGPAEFPVVSFAALSQLS